MPRRGVFARADGAGLDPNRESVQESRMASIGVVDCAGWFWKNAPTALAGILSGRKVNRAFGWRRCVISISGFGISSLVSRVRTMISTYLKSALTSTESLPVRSPLLLQRTLLLAKSSAIFTINRTAYILDGKSLRKPCRTLRSCRKSSTLETRNVPGSESSVFSECCFVIS
jgi:hypothetical protein